MRSDAPFGFVQFEFAFPLGPEDGRYLARAGPEAEPRLVIVVRTVGTPPRRARRLRGVKRAEPKPVSISRASVVRAEPFDSSVAADEWLGRLRGDDERLRTEVELAGRELNHVIHAHRAIAADPYSRDVGPEIALTVRVGHGSGDQVADGRFASAYELPRRAQRRRRVERLSPQEHLAAVLAGREEVLSCEELVLRARADIAADRPREAALQARIALECVLADLEGRIPKADLSELAVQREKVSRASNAALEGQPPEELRAAVEGAVSRMELAIRRYRLAAPDHPST